MLIFVSDEQFRNVEDSIALKLFGIAIVSKDVHSWNAADPIEITVVGILSVFNFEQRLNAEYPILSSPSDIAIDSIFPQA